MAQQANSFSDLPVDAVQLIATHFMENGSSRVLRLVSRTMRSAVDSCGTLQMGRWPDEAWAPARNTTQVDMLQLGTEASGQLLSSLLQRLLPLTRLSSLVLSTQCLQHHHQHTLAGQAHPGPVHQEAGPNPGNVDSTNQSHMLQPVLQIPDALSSLTTLTHLAIVQGPLPGEEDDSQMLPEFVGNLINLQALSLQGFALPRRQLSQLTQLRHLELHQLRCIVRSILHISKLASLTSLKLRVSTRRNDDEGTDEAQALMAERVVLLSGLQRLQQAQAELNETSKVAGRARHDPREQHGQHTPVLLKTLHLTGWRWPEVPPLIMHWSSIQELDLSGSEIDAPGLAMAAAGNRSGAWRLDHLTSLVLARCNLAFMPEELCAASPALVKLDLSHNMLMDVAANIGELSSLRELRLQGNLMQQMPSLLLLLNQLEFLDVSSMRVASLPPWLMAFRALRHLDISRNMISEMSSDVSRLQELTFLDVSRNRLTTLPASLSCLTKLVHLSFAMNYLGKCDITLSALVQLSHLELAHACFSYRIPGGGEAWWADIAALSHLSALICHSNTMNAVPSCWQQLRLMKKLDLSRNCVVELPSEFSHLSHLCWLDICYNTLTDLGPITAGMDNLRHLNASHNCLASVSTDIGRLAGLTELDLSHNALTTLPLSISCLVGLVTLDVGGNYALCQLPTAAVSALYALQVFRVDQVLWAEPVIPMLTMRGVTVQMQYRFRPS